MAELRINDQIRVPSVRLIGSKGEQLGVVPTARAFAKAQEDGLDLVEIAPSAVPPVCKILDFGKYRYEEQQRVKDAKKKQKAVIWKEIRMAPKIDEHDIETKIKAAVRFLDEGDKLKVTVRFRGRENAHPDRGRTLLLGVADRLKEHGVIERMPLLEGRQMIMIMNPVRAQPVAAGRPATAAAPAAPAPLAAAAPARPAGTPNAPAAAQPTPPPAAAPKPQPVAAAKDTAPRAPAAAPTATPPAAPARTAPARPATSARRV